MDDLDQREAFLQAIFAHPDDDLPRLVFADWLDEQGESEWAELIRVQCELARLPQNYLLPDQLVDMDRRDALLDRNIQQLREWSKRSTEDVSARVPTVRGFLREPWITCAASDLADPDEFRKNAIRRHPEWYGATALRVSVGLIASSKPISTILQSTVTQFVSSLDLSGSVMEEADPLDHVVMSSSRVDEYELSLAEFTYRPTVTLQAVEALVSARECRRITHLDLRNNDLDNDAARAIVRSTNLIRLKSLHLFDGNRLRGRTWAQLQERFGEDVVQ